jgi:hypothetical protein
MGFLNSTKSSCSSYSSSVSSSSMLELDVDQSSSSAKIFSVLSKPDTPVQKTGPSNFLRLQNSVLLFEHMIALLDLDQNV